MIINNSREGATTPQQPNPTEMDLFEMLASVLVTMGRGEHILQCMRETLATDPLFTPMSLFKYLTKGCHYLTREQVLQFLEENSMLGDEGETEEIIGKIFTRYHMGWSPCYTDFLNFIYPYNSSILREIANNRMKIYPDLDRHQKNLRPADSVITGFLLLIQEEITVQKKIDVQISDTSFPNKDKLRKIVKSIKKASLRLTTTITEKSQQHISMLQLRNYIKAFIDVPEHLFLSLGRRLGMEKNGQVPIENIEAALKKGKKKNIPHKHNQQEEEESEPVIGEEESKQEIKLKHKYVGNSSEEEEGSDPRQAKEINYREQLYKQLANTLKIKNKNQKNKTNRTPRGRGNSRSNQNSLKQKSIKKQNNPYNVSFSGFRDSFEGDSQPKQKLDDNSLSFQRDTSFRRQTYEPPQQMRVTSSASKNKQQRSKKTRATDNLDPKSINKIFKEFVEIFFKGNREIERCRMKISQYQKIDFLQIFKSLDHGKGVIQAQDLRQFYVRLSGIPTDYDFQLLIDRFAQPDEKWLSYSQFADIFRSPTKTQGTSSLKNSTSDYSSKNLSPQLMRLLAQTIYLILDLEQSLKTVLSKLKYSEKQWLFTRINIDSDSKGFINYQELKKYLSEQLQVNISMMDLMSLLKRLDKSKNGVVVREEFLRL